MIIQKRLRHWLSRRPWLYELGAMLKMVWLRYTYSGGDAIAAISLLSSSEGLAIDVGAHRGQSAIRMLKLKPHFQVVSFEPNPRCLLALRFTRILVGNSFHFEPCGLCDKAGELTYYEPYIDALPVTAEGTFRVENLDDSLRERIGDFQVRRLILPLRTMDEMNLSPSFIKIDVQGGEFEVLKGGRDTIARCHPIIVVERNPLNEQNVAEFLGALGYMPLKDAKNAAKLGGLPGDDVFIPPQPAGSVAGRGPGSGMLSLAFPPVQ